MAKLTTEKLTLRYVAGILFLATYLISFSIGTGTFGTIDTFRRYKTTEAIWKNQPPIADFDISTAVPGVNNTLHYWYNPGQSIYMLPADIGVSVFLDAFLPGTNYISNNQLTLKNLLVASLIFPFFSASAVVIVFLLLFQLNFSRYATVVGALAFFFGTTFLHYSQLYQENIHITFLVLCSYYEVLLWLKYRKILNLVLGTLLAGSLFLIRITTIADIVGLAAFVFLALFFERTKPHFFQKIFTVIFAFAVSTGIFYLFDRLYNFKRFGTFSGNYIDLLRDKMRADSPRTGVFVSPNWPFTASPWEVIPSVLFSPQKSLFIYDPLLLLLILVVLVSKFKINLAEAPKYRLYLLAGGLVSLLAYLVGYSTTEFWSGDWAWGARYHLSPVHLLCVLAVPLFLEKFKNLPLFGRILGWLLISFALIAQVASITLNLATEFLQASCGIGTPFTLGNRLVNIYLALTSNLQFCSNSVVQDARQMTNFAFWPFSFDPPVLFVFSFFWLVCLGLAFFILFNLLRRLKTTSHLD